jgi:hypothetical protein
MRYAARVDKNQAEIVKALRDAGAYVWIIGLPVDLLVGYKGHSFLVEVKDGSKKRSRYHHGFIAQQVRDTGIQFGGYQDHSINGGDNVMSIGYDEFIAPIVKTLQERG